MAVVRWCFFFFSLISEVGTAVVAVGEVEGAEGFVGGALLAFNSSDATRDTEGTPATVKKNEVPSVDSGQLDVKPRKSMPDGEPSQKGSIVEPTYRRVSVRLSL